MLEQEKLVTSYANALYELSVEENKETDYYKFLENFSNALTEQFLFLMSSREFSYEKKAEVIEKLFKKLNYSNLKNFFLIVIRNNSFLITPQIINEFEKIYFAKHNIKKATLITAFSLEASQMKKIISTLENKFKSEIKYKNIIDQSLIGGIKVTVGDKVYDYSIQKQLLELKKQLEGVAND